ncbi:acyl-CoA dehydrogenase family protein [Nocardia sp. NPDC004085]
MPAATVDYAGVREQFVRPIGSFQAVKRACADLLVRIAVAGQLVAAAVRADVASGPDAGGAASRAKAFTPETAVRVAGKAMQLHGRMVTCGRAGSTPIASEPRSIGVMFGTPAEHRRRLAGDSPRHSERGADRRSAAWSRPGTSGQSSGVSVKRCRYSGSPSFSTRSSSVSR